jgi:hypothetical protein
MQSRTIQAAIALGAVAVVSAIAQLVLVDADHVESPIWGADVLGVWPLIALASVGLLTAIAVLASVARLVLEHDPYTQADEPASTPPHEQEEASDG